MFDKSFISFMKYSRQNQIMVEFDQVSTNSDVFIFSSWMM